MGTLVTREAIRAKVVQTATDLIDLADALEKDGELTVFAEEVLTELRSRSHAALANAVVHFVSRFRKG